MQQLLRDLQFWRARWGVTTSRAMKVLHTNWDEIFPRRPRRSGFYRSLWKELFRIQRRSNQESRRLRSRVIAFGAPRLCRAFAQIRLLPVIMNEAHPNTALKRSRVALTLMESYRIWDSNILSHVRANPRFTCHCRRQSCEYSAEKIQRRADFNQKISRLGFQDDVARPRKSRIYRLLRRKRVRIQIRRVRINAIAAARGVMV